MGYAGQPMKVVKANRALLKKKRNFRDIRKDYIGHAGETQLQFKELTEFEKKKIRDKIIAQAKRDKLIELRASIISVLILAILVFIIYRMF
ncbi:hypothetical protein [Croceitalea vernalis]|uniref:Riboflavin synthase subunit beta n=1 Tax=Croceitalea vernalis TaxID=3075599 RepID=A0ABU3BCU4_9FLAO|nr:hypothetical protein [Croceitalea sp. P007]MDT0620284.1 hypothetical protein [Croceitalea sp. P007]